jgi:hypothetical protein
MSSEKVQAYVDQQARVEGMNGYQCLPNQMGKKTSPESI